MQDELFINGTSVDLSKSVPFPITYQIADITEPENRKGANSKTVTLPGTDVNLQLMSGIFSLSVSDQPGENPNGFFNFDPTVKATARMYSNGILVFNGVCQLLSAKLNDGTWSFQVTLFSDFINFMNDLKSIKVNELGWSEYDHELVKENLERSWNGQVVKDGNYVSNQTSGAWDGFGYYYGLIDYGFPRLAEDTFKIEEVVPQVFSYEILKKMFDAVGVTFKSEFLESKFYKKILCAWEGGPLPVVTVEERNQQSVLTSEENSITGGYNIKGEFLLPVYAKQENENTPLEDLLYYNLTNGSLISSVYNFMNVGVDSDPSGQLTNDYPYAVTIFNDGVYDFKYSGTLEFNARIIADGGIEALTYFEGDLKFDYAILIKKNNVTIDTIPVTSFASSVGGNGRQQFIAFDIERTFELETSDLIEIQLKITNKPITGAFFPDGTGTGGSTSYYTDYSVSVLATQPEVNLLKTATNFVPGQDVFLRYFVPSMDCATYLKGIIQKWNLYVMPDPNDDKLLYIEPLEDFYQGTDQADDWTQLLDYSKTVEVVPTAAVASKSYLFGFKDDKDEFNERYRSDTLKQYGSKEIQSNVDFSQEQTKTILPFSTKPICLIPNTTLIMPRSYQIKDDKITPKKGTPFHVFIGSPEFGTFQELWKLVDENDNTQNMEKYPYVGHLDNYNEPTFDMGFGVPEFVFYDAPSYTNNNLYGYHERFLLEIVDRYGKILKAYFNLTKADINKLDFSILKNIDGVMFRLQKINNYDPTNTDASTKCELIRLIEGQKGSTGNPSVPIEDGDTSVSSGDPVEKEQDVKR